MEQVAQLGIVEQIEMGLNEVVGWVWSTPLVVTLVGVGILFTLILGFPQLKGFIHALKVVTGKYDDPNDPGQISHFQALCTALSATVGLGNIAGVAVAIRIGGPGATFWMIVVGLLGMATKYTEVSLALMYRSQDESGKTVGGPMYYIENGLGKKWKPLAVFFAFACLCGSYGASNMFQSNQVASILNINFGIEGWITGVVLAVLTGVVIIGGIERIGQVTSKLVPFMGGIYVVGAGIVIFKNFGAIPEVISQIMEGAFSGTAAAGGFTGALFAQVVTQGVRRACFSNEAGLGSSPIAHSAASTKEPIREGVVALLEPFVDTVCICTMTAFVILLSGSWTDPAENVNGVILTAKAFDSAIEGFGTYFVPVAVALFAYSTLLSWSYYGETCARYLFGPKGVLPYKIIFCFLAVLGAVRTLGPVLAFSDIMLGLMVVPNLFAVLLLFPKLKKESDSYFRRLKNGDFDLPEHAKASTGAIQRSTTEPANS